MQSGQTIRERTFASLKSLGTLTLLLLAFPFSLSVVVGALLWSSLTSLFQKRRVQVEPKRILLTGAKMTKCLTLARSFHAAGHQVFMVETKKYWLSGNQFSNCVEALYTVPAPQHDAEGYIQGLLNIVKQEKIDMFIPVSSPVASYYDSLAKPALSPYCEVFAFDAETTKLLDNKFTFNQKAHSVGLSAPKTFLITNPEQVLNFDFATDGSQYILKSIAYDSINRLALLKLPCAPATMAKYVHSLPISEENPWIMQEFLKGQEYCTHAVVREGKLMLYACSKSCDFLVNYEHDYNPAILDWVTRFVKALNLTGQICLDFIQAEDGTVYPIECNPRTSTCITMFHDQPKVVADAYLSSSASILKEPVQPLPDSKPTYWTFHELWRLITKVKSWQDLQYRLGIIFNGVDPVFHPRDPLPFLGVNHWQIPLLILNNVRQLKGWERIDFNIGKLVQLGGD
jgi:predicted ATP-grasp superfamily ATP-dependent carboligase